MKKRDPQLPARIDAGFIAKINKQRLKDHLSWAGLCYWLFDLYVSKEIVFGSKTVERKL